MEDINWDTANTEAEEESASVSKEEEPERDSTGKNSFFLIFYHWFLGERWVGGICVQRINLNKKEMILLS